eukprot:scaffold7730_cov78-Skeletonema_dohrnii-CCMP3373.AAC.2
MSEFESRSNPSPSPKEDHVGIVEKYRFCLIRHPAKGAQRVPRTQRKPQKHPGSRNLGFAFGGGGGSTGRFASSSAEPAGR